MLSFLKAPANAPLITDKHEVDARYRYWRRHILITIWLGYALFYFTRKALTPPRRKSLPAAFCPAAISACWRRCFISPTGCRNLSPASLAIALTLAILWASG